MGGGGGRLLQVPCEVMLFSLQSLLVKINWPGLWNIQPWVTLETPKNFVSMWSEVHTSSNFSSERPVPQWFFWSFFRHQRLFPFLISYSILKFFTTGVHGNYYMLILLGVIGFLMINCLTDLVNSTLPLKYPFGGFFRRFFSSSFFIPVSFH